MNKLLQRQLQKHFGKVDQVPENFVKLLNVISESYDHYEKDRRLIERSIDLSSKEMIELNNQVKKSGKDELQKVHTQLKTLFENIEEIVYSVDMVSLKILQISAVCEKVYGYTSAEFMTDRDLWQKVILPEDIYVVHQHFKELYEGKQVTGQYRILHKDKSIRWLESKIIPTLDEAGQLVRMDGVTIDISDRKRAEKELEKSVSLLEATIESTADGILVADFNGKMIRFNKKFVELTRIPQEILDEQDDEKAISFLLDQLTNPEEFLSKVKELYVHQKDVSFDTINFKDGRTFERYSQPQLINGNCVGRVWSFRDITERKKSEAAIIKAYEDKNTVLERIDDGFFAVDKNSIITYWNKRAEILLDAKKEDVIGKNLHEVFAATASNAFYKHYQKALSENRTVHFEEFSIRTNKWFAVGAFASDNGLSVYFKDVTERKESEDKIKQSELRYRSVIEDANDAICITDSSMKFYDMNPSGCKMLGYSKEEFLKLSIPDLFFTEDLQANPFKIEDLKSGKPIRSDRRFKRKDGAIIEVDLSGKLMEDGRFIMFGRDITERKQTEKLLQESEMRYRNLIEQATDAICIADATMKFIDVNRYGCEFLGYSKEETLQLSVMDILFREDLVSNPFKFDEVQPGEIIRNERRLKRKDGTSVIMEVSTRMTEDGRFIMFGHDVSARRRSEHALRESEKQLRQIIDLVPHFIFAKDAKGKFVLANEAVARAYGSAVEDLIGKTDADFNSKEEEVEHFLQEDLKVINSGNVKYNVEETITDATGNIRVLSTTKIPYTSPGFDIPGVLGVSVDISERKKAETVLKQSEGQLSIASKIAKLGYWEFDVPEGLFTFNDQFYAIFKTTAEEVGGYIMRPDHYAERFVYPDDRAVVGMEVGNAINSPDPHFSRNIEHRIVYATGEIGWISVHFYIVKDENGQTIKTFGVNQDITERKKGEETLLRSEANLELKNNELEFKNKELEQFVYVASHDLQEPLRTTSSFAELLQQQYKGRLDEKADQYLTFITQSSDRMKVLINDLLDYSRIGRKKERKKVDCNIIMQEVLADLDTAIKESGAEIKPDPLPVINGYPTEIKQLFQNLVMNAIKFRKANTSPQINIAAYKKDGYWEFTCKDNGIGIEEQHKERIFVIFQRLHTRTEYEGSGIGLAHVKKIVELHGGKIWLESVPGEGTTFHFKIPLSN